jgi:predicted Zn-dependent protease
MAAKNDDPSALDTLGWLYHRMGNREMAAEALRKAFEKQPDNPTIGLHYASVLAEGGARKQARDILLKVREQRLKPRDRASLDNLLKTL